jgi:hypothetical protein
MNPIEAKISRLQDMIPSDQSGVFHSGGISRTDWRPIWNLCKEIQSDFRGCKDFPSREQHQAAWSEFQEARSKASEICDAEKEGFKAQSAVLRNELLSNIRACRFSKLSDVLFFFDPTTVEEVKDMGRRLNEAGQRLSKEKEWMLSEHKAECFEEIQNARATLDDFWEQRKSQGLERKRQHEQRQSEFEAKQSDWRDRVNANISRNREKLNRAVSAHDRVIERIDEIETKIHSAENDKWRGIFGEWLSEALEKKTDIEESIDRIRGWISEDVAKL